MALALRRRSRISDAGTDEVRSEQKYLDSGLLAMLFAQVEEGQTLRVLDIGAGAAETVAFLSRFRCRLHCADWLDESSLLAPCSPEEESIRIPALRRMLGVDGAASYDVCLFWDVFQYLDSSAVRVLGRALAPAVTEATLAHAFFHHGRGASSPTEGGAHRYGILAADRMSLRACQPPILPAQPCAQREVLEQLRCFAVEKSRLLQGGLLESVLSGSGD